MTFFRNGYNIVRVLSDERDTELYDMHFNETDLLNKLNTGFVFRRDDKIVRYK